MERYTVPVLGMRENAPALPSRGGQRQRRSQMVLKAAAIARTVTPRLTQGPQSAAPAIITMANRGKKDLPKASLVREKKPRDIRSILLSLPLRFTCAACEIAKALLRKSWFDGFQRFPDWRTYRRPGEGEQTSPINRGGKIHIG